jgi:DNA uptake protein ComE-like DNA-binding protein
MKFVRIITIAGLAIMMFAGNSARGGQDPAAAKADAAPAGLVDINHATLAELRTLPGVGEAYSLAIVKHRPYKNKTQLRSKGAIPLAEYKRIKDRIIAKQ